MACLKAQPGLAPFLGTLKYEFSGLTCVFAIPALIVLSVVLMNLLNLVVWMIKK